MTGDAAAHRPVDARPDDHDNRTDDRTDTDDRPHERKETTMTTADTTDSPTTTADRGGNRDHGTTSASWRTRIGAFARPGRALLLAAIVLTPLYVVIDLHWGIGLLHVWAAVLFFEAASGVRAARQLRVPAGSWLLGSVPPVLAMGLLAAGAGVAWSAYEISRNPHFSFDLLSRSGNAPHMDTNGEPYLVEYAGFGAGDMALSFAVIVLAVAAAAYVGIFLAAFSARRGTGRTVLLAVAIIVVVVFAESLIAWLAGGVPFTRDRHEPAEGWRLVAAPAIVSAVTLAWAVPAALREYRGTDA
ncbi:hypothetical protein [Corynebacterium sp. 335C]